VLRARDEGLPLPAAIVLLTPEADLTESGDSFATLLGIDPVLTASLAESIALYAGTHDLNDPYRSPLFGDFTAFPPTLLQAGTRDLFLSNAVRLHRRMRSAGVAAELHVSRPCLTVGSTVLQRMRSSAAKSGSSCARSSSVRWPRSPECAELRAGAARAQLGSALRGRDPRRGRREVLGE
jgi:acetyl esterase/lipase